MESELFGDDLQKLYPIMREGASDSARFDNALEFLCLAGRELPEAVLMMIPEAWENLDEHGSRPRAYYEYHSFMMEPWDGPASLAFTDGRRIGAVLDRNGLRPSRYVVTKDGFVVMASEVGVVDIEPENVLQEGAPPPRQGSSSIDLEEGRIIEDEELKARYVARRPYRDWVEQNRVILADLPKRPRSRPSTATRAALPAPAGLRLHDRGPEAAARRRWRSRASGPSAPWARTRPWPVSRTGRRCSTATSSSSSPRSRTRRWTRSTSGR